MESVIQTPNPLRAFRLPGVSATPTSPAREAAVGGLVITACGRSARTSLAHRRNVAFDHHHVSDNLGRASPRGYEPTGEAFSIRAARAGAVWHATGRGCRSVPFRIG